MHVRCPDRLPEEGYRQVLELPADLSPVVQALPPTAALVELKGALPYYGGDAHRLGEMLRIRAISRRGIDVRVGIGPTVTVAATASAQIPRPGGVLTVPTDEACKRPGQGPPLRLGNMTAALIRQGAPVGASAIVDLERAAGGSGRRAGALVVQGKTPRFLRGDAGARPARRTRRTPVPDLSGAGFLHVRRRPTTRDGCYPLLGDGSRSGGVAPPGGRAWGETAVILPEGLQLYFNQVPERKTVKNRIHLCLRPETSREEEVQRLLGLGATLVADRREPDGAGWTVLADPEGNEFCVLRSAAERAAMSS